MNVVRLVFVVLSMVDAKFPPYKQAIAAHGTAIVGLQLQIAYGLFQKLCLTISP